MVNLNLFKKVYLRNLFIFVIIVILAFIIRILYIPQNSISFHYDMSRDAFVAKEIWENHDLKILGVPSSLSGVYHGVLYYYIIAPFYGLGEGDPRLVSYFLAFINSMTVFPVMFLAKALFKSEKFMILSGVLFAVSFEAVQYSTWLSNPGPAIFTTAMFFYSLWLWLNKGKWGLPMAIFWAALSMQFQVFLVYLFLVIIVFKIVFKPEVNLKQIVTSLVILFLVSSTFLMSAIQFNLFKSTFEALVSVNNSSYIGIRTDFTEMFLRYINRFAEIFINNFFPVNVVVGGLLGFITLYFNRKSLFILFLLFSGSLIFIFGGHNSGYTNLGMVVPAILALTYFLKKLREGYTKIGAFLLVTVILIANLYTIVTVSPLGQLILVIPKGMLLEEQLKLIDTTYEFANGQPFAINSITLPLWTNTTWSYLYQFYGSKKYGYLPYFYGRNQVGMPGEESLIRIEKPLDISFLIMEPLDGIPQQFYIDELAKEDSKTKVIQEFEFSSLKLQLRKPLGKIN